MAAALHQLKIIQLFALLGRAEHRVVGIIHEYHDMRHLQQSLFTHLDSRRKPVLDRMLGGPYGGMRAISPVICFKVEGSDYAAPQHTALKPALNADIAVLIFFEYAAVKILGHGFVDPVALGLGILNAKLRLWQDESERRGLIADCFIHLFPILGLRGELVAGHDAPRVHIGLGNKNICRFEYLHQSTSSAI